MLYLTPHYSNILEKYIRTLLFHCCANTNSRTQFTIDLKETKINKHESYLNHHHQHTHHSYYHVIHLKYLIFALEGEAKTIQFRVITVKNKNHIHTFD